jgi:protein SCO1/2
MYQIVFFKISILAIVIWMLGCKYDPKTPQQLPYYNTSNFTPEFFNTSSEALEKVSHNIGDFSFTDQNSKTYSDRNIDDKIHVANFIFTSCGSICPMMTANMKLVAEAYPNNPRVDILSYTVTPWIDSVARLHQYAERNDITVTNWHFLTGSKSEIYTLARTSYFAEEELGFTKDSTEFLHTEHVLLIDKNKRIRGIYNGTLALEMKQLAKDIGILMKE